MRRRRKQQSQQAIRYHRATKCHPQDQTLTVRRGSLALSVHRDQMLCREYLSRYIDSFFSKHAIVHTEVRWSHLKRQGSISARTCTKRRACLVRSFHILFNLDVGTTSCYYTAVGRGRERERERERARERWGDRKRERTKGLRGCYDPNKACIKATTHTLTDEVFPAAASGHSFGVFPKWLEAGSFSLLPIDRRIGDRNVGIALCSDWGQWVGTDGSEAWVRAQERARLAPRPHSNARRDFENGVSERGGNRVSRTATCRFDQTYR